MHSALPGGFAYNGTNYVDDDASVAQGDNFLSLVIPKIMASAAYQNNGLIILWMDETEDTDDTNSTIPCVIISPLAKGNAYASTLPCSHSSDLKTMDEIFQLAYQTNALPSTYLDAQNTGYDYVNGSSAPINDLSDFFAPGGLKISSPAVQSNGNFTLSFFGPFNQTYEVLATSDLTQPQSAWTVVASGVLGSTNVVFTDTNTANYHGRYYVVKSP